MKKFLLILLFLFPLFAFTQVGHGYKEITYAPHPIYNFDNPYGIKRYHYDFNFGYVYEDDLIFLDPYWDWNWNFYFNYNYSYYPYYSWNFYYPYVWYQPHWNNHHHKYYDHHKNWNYDNRYYGRRTMGNYQKVTPYTPPRYQYRRDQRGYISPKYRNYDNRKYRTVEPYKVRPQKIDVPRNNPNVGRDPYAPNRYERPINNQRFQTQPQRQQNIRNNPGRNNTPNQSPRRR